MAFSYSDFVDYSKLDPVKRIALDLFEPTLSYPERLGIKFIPESFGSAAVSFDFSGIPDSDWLLASNIEGLGTKNRIADQMYANASREQRHIADRMESNSIYRGLGQDVVAMSSNDQLSIGADIFAYGDIIACGNSNWFSNDLDRTRELLLGYRIAADLGQFAIPQGETPELPDIINPENLDLAGASLGLIRPKTRLITGQKIQEGDLIFGLASSGPHANGLTKIRRISENLPLGYFSEINSGATLGAAVLTPTILYTRPVIEMFNQGADIHYLQPITGHGWAKICRANYQFTYVVENAPAPLPIFQHLIELGNIHGFNMTHRENYYTWNMGIGFVVIAPKTAEPVIRGTASDAGIIVHELGYVEKGERQVVMPFYDGQKQVVYRPQL